MNALLILFWLSLAILLYCYLGYGIIAGCITLLQRILHKRKPAATDRGEDITLVVTAFREGDMLRKKIANIAELNYPADRLRVIFVVDEPEPEVIELFRTHPGITLLIQPERKGKYEAIKLALQQVKTAIVCFSDANSLLNPDAITRMMLHYNDPRVGAVAGEKKIAYREKDSAVGQAEGWYWEYESFMKKLDAGIYTVVGAAGELFSMRSRLFRPLDKPVILDDLVMSMQVCLQGFRIAYEPGAFASELPSSSLAEEAKRKTRIAAGAFQSLGLLKEALHPFGHPLLFFQFVSRRFFRWVLGPLALILLPISNLLIVSLGHPSLFFRIMLGLQLLFFAMGGAGYMLIRNGRKAGLCNIPFYFLFMHYCLVRGFFRFLGGNQSALWERSVREAAP